MVSIFETRDLQARQDIRFFGTISGVTLVDGGDEIVVANGDRSVGGLMSFRRTEHGDGYVDAQGGSVEHVERCERRTGRKRNARRAGVVQELIL